MFTVRALVVGLLVFGLGRLALANEPQPKKPNPPKPNPQQQQQLQRERQQQQQRLQQQQQLLTALRLEQYQALQQMRLFMLEGMWNRYMLTRLRTPFVPAFAPPYAYLPNYLPGMTNNPTTPTAPATSMAGFSRELVLELASTTTYSQLRPGSLTQYQPATADALKVGQVISVLAKNDPKANKPGTWSFPAQITAIDDGDPKKLTVMAKLDAAQEGFTPDNKIITAVTIRQQPTVAQK